MATEEVSYKYTKCRTFGHSWGIFVEDETPTNVGVVVVNLLCRDCPATRKDVINRRGSLSYRSYTRPDDYAVDQRYAKDEWRADFVEEATRKARKK